MKSVYRAVACPFIAFAVLVSAAPLASAAKTSAVKTAPAPKPVQTPPPPKVDSTKGTADAKPVAPKTFQLITAVAGQAPHVALGDSVQVKIDGTGAIDPSKYVLWIDSGALGVTPDVDQAQRVLVFQLVRKDSNRPFWAHLLGAPFGSDQFETLPISLVSGDHAISFASAAGMAPKSQVVLQRYNSGLMTFGIFVVGLVIVLTGAMVGKTTMMRDTLVPQMPLEDRSYSLGRFQMTVWFCLIFASFFFILIVAGDANSIIAENFVLLGISGATALGAAAIENTKDSPKGAIEAVLTQMNLTSAAQVAKFRNAVTAGNGAALASTVDPNVVLPGTAAPTVKQIWDAYVAQIAPIKTAGFWRDLVNDVNGPTIHRWQILVWTLVLGGLYITRVYSNLEMPTLGTNLLALLGISSGVYLGFKIPKRQN